MTKQIYEVDGMLPLRPTAYDANDVRTDNLDKVVEQLEQALALEITRVEKCDKYYFGQHPAPYMPKEASAEYRALAERSITNVMPLIVNNIAQLLHIENYLPSEPSDETPEAWLAWLANRMDSRQAALFRSVLRYGVAYTTTQVVEGAKYPKIRGLSPRQMIALYEDPANDEYPAYALEVIDWDQSGQRIYKLWDETHVYTLRRDPGKGIKLGEYESEEHGFNRPPIVRWTYNLDLEGRYQGEIEPLMVAQDRLNQTVMDRMLVQTFASWKVRTVAGMVLPSNEEDATQDKFRIAKDRILIADDPDTKFGSLPETPLAGFLQAANVDDETIAATAAVPPHYLTGSLNNLGAEAIAEARAAMDAKAVEIQHGLGEAAGQNLRLVAALMGDTKAAEDFAAVVGWRDTQNRSISATADALGKMATMLSIPVEVLWERLPGVTTADVARWRELKEEQEAAAIAQQMELMGADDDTDAANPESPGRNNQTERSNRENGTPPSQ